MLPARVRAGETVDLRVADGAGVIEGRLGRQALDLVIHHVGDGAVDREGAHLAEPDRRIDLKIETGGLVAPEVEQRLVDIGEHARAIALDQLAIIIVRIIGRVQPAQIEALVQGQRAGDVADRVLDGDVVVIDREGETLQQRAGEVGLEHRTDGVAVGRFLVQVGIADAKGIGAARIAIGADQVLRHAIGNA